MRSCWDHQGNGLLFLLLHDGSFSHINLYEPPSDLINANVQIPVKNMNIVQPNVCFPRVLARALHGLHLNYFYLVIAITATDKDHHYVNISSSSNICAWGGAQGKCSFPEVRATKIEKGTGLHALNHSHMQSNNKASIREWSFTGKDFSKNICLVCTQ